MDRTSKALLDHLPHELILACYAKAPGNELAGKFNSPASSAALAANAFGLFLNEPTRLGGLPGLDDLHWPAVRVDLESEVRFPWTGGRHPCLDAVIRTSDALIGVESKRYEPFRTHRPRPESEAYDRPVWGPNMASYLAALSEAEAGAFKHLDAAQLAKHALAIRTQVHREADNARSGVLYYVYCEPAHWPDGSLVKEDLIREHDTEIRRFASMVADAEIRFVSATYSALIDAWRATDVRHHATALDQWLYVAP